MCSHSDQRAYSNSKGSKSVYSPLWMAYTALAEGNLTDGTTYLRCSAYRVSNSVKWTPNAATVPCSVVASSSASRNSSLSDRYSVHPRKLWFAGMVGVGTLEHPATSNNRAIRITARIRCRPYSRHEQKSPQSQRNPRRIPYFPVFALPQPPQPHTTMWPQNQSRCRPLPKESTAT